MRYGTLGVQTSYTHGIICVYNVQGSQLYMSITNQAPVYNVFLMNYFMKT